MPPQGRAGLSVPAGRSVPAGFSVPAGLCVTVLAALLLLGGVVAVGPWDGVFLFRDFVTVPDPVLGANTLGGGGAPRAVPLDAVVAILSAILPAGLVARALLIGPLLLVGAGMSVLLRAHGAVATALGAGLAITNPYVAERLLLGQAPTLFGFAMIPWLVLAVRSRRPLSQRALLVLLAAAPAALTPVGSVMAGLTVLVTGLTLDSGRRPAFVSTLVLLLPVGVLALPWLVAALAHPSTGAVSSGADAFAVRADGPLGTIGSVLTLGGVWAPGAWPPSRAELPVVLAQLALVVSAAAAWWWLRRRGPVAPRSADLMALAFVVPVVGVLLLSGPLLPVWRVLQQVPGLALARDTHRWLAWSALAVAALVALGVAALVKRLVARGTPARSTPAHVAAVPVTLGTTLAVLALGIFTVADVPGTLARDAGPVATPPEWDTVIEIVNGDPEGRVLLLPWQPFRQVDWVGDVQFLDPLPRALEPEVLHARDLTVRRDGVEWHVGGEDPAFAAAFTAERLDADLLAREGITRVVVWQGSPGVVPERGEGWQVLHEGAAWQVWDLAPSGETKSREPKSREPSASRHSP